MTFEDMPKGLQGEVAANVNAIHGAGQSHGFG
jgi:hypothetical protein